MAGSIRCGRCGREAAPLPEPPLPGESGLEVQASVCASCWAEWRQMEIMVINELRLDFMNPESGRILDQHMREFLALPRRIDPGS